MSVKCKLKAHVCLKMYYQTMASEVFHYTLEENYSSNISLWSIADEVVLILALGTKLIFTLYHLHLGWL